MSQGQIPKAALRWTATDKRKRRTLKTTWPRTVLSELKEMGVTWRETDEAAQDRVKWINHFWVAFRLCFKARPSAKPSKWQSLLFICNWNKTNFSYERLCPRQRQKTTRKLPKLQSTHSTDPKILARYRQIPSCFPDLVTSGLNTARPVSPGWGVEVEYLTLSVVRPSTL